MTIYVGGLRSRLIRDSLIKMVSDSLEALGWFQTDRQHKPLNVIAVAIDDEEVPLNTLAFTEDDMVSSEDELGSLMAEHAWTWFIDFYAEDNSVGLHVIQDVKAILEGRMPSIGRGDPHLDVIDFTLATPVKIFSCEIQDVETHKAHGFPRAFQRFWHSVSFTLIDRYGDEEDD